MEKVEPETQNMPCWYYEKTDLKKTPSFYDGINAETESRYRREGSRFIYDVGTKLGLHYNTIATGVVFFHRFYMFHSFKKFHRHVTATCCLFLAGKVEETPKKCKDLIKVGKSLLNEAQFAQFGDDPKEEVLTFEKVLLQTIKFDLTVEHPYKYMLQYANGLKGDRSKIEKLVQMSWTFINDSLSTSLCLQWEPQIIAVAVMYLAGRICKFEPQDWAYNRGKWWEQFIDDISTELLEDICHQILDHYQREPNKPGLSKGKRERPKTPGDRDKTSEPQAKTSRSEAQKSSQKPKPSQTSASQKSHASRPAAPPSKDKSSTSSNQRRVSSNTEVVAMDTVDTTDRGAIEQGKPPAAKTSSTQPTTPASSAPTPTKSSVNEQSSSLYNINQYQSFIGSTDQNSLAFMQPAGYTGAAFPSTFPGLPVTGQTPPLRPSFSGSNPAQQNFPSFPGSFDNSFHQFPHTPEAAQNSYPHYPPPVTGQTSTGLATVRITGRREQAGNSQWQ